MHSYALVFVIVGALVGVGLVAYFRCHDRVRTLLCVLLVVGAVWLAVDFVITPQDRWLNGITLAVVAVVAGGAVGYQRLRSSKTH